ncbi:MAG: glutamate--tRNA ligase [Pirellulaceae bacterium]
MELVVRTRFAPSPTGYLHIGGVRTALFNWLFARRHGGQFILRIDDTDQQRNIDEALRPILDGFRWLGLDWDEGPEVDGPHAPYFQSQRGDRYQQAVVQLIESGAAYYDFATTEEIQAEREAAEREKRDFIYSRRFAAWDEATRQRYLDEGRQSVVRLKMPREGTLVLKDHIRGEVRFDWAREQDHVIQRPDGTCLYHLANVVDDFDFQITHVIRAEEHLSNTPRQVFIAQNLGYPLPEYAHIPFVAEPGSKKKLSKRSLDKYLKNRDFKLNDLGQRIAVAAGLETHAETFNPVIVDFYQQVGFLPDAVVNYLVLLGWSLDGASEDFTRAQMIEHFSLERVNDSAASFDPLKLLAFQDRYMQRLPIKQKVKMAVDFLQRAGLVASPPSCDVGPRVAEVLSAAGDRVRVAGDILEYDDFFMSDDELPYDESAMEKRLIKPADAVPLLQQYRQRLVEVADFQPAALEATLKEFVEQQQIKIGQVIHALRVAVTGKSVGFGMFETMAILGRESTLRRIDRALEGVQAARGT